MKIDESCINHNALRLIHEKVSGLYEYTDDNTDFENMRLAILGEIRGICTLTEVLKEVLQA